MTVPLLPGKQLNCDCGHGVDCVAGTPALIETKTLRPEKKLEAVDWGSSHPVRMMTAVTYTLQPVTTIMYTPRLRDRKGKALWSTGKALWSTGKALSQ